MEPVIYDKIHDVDLQKTMENSYIDYAMSVIASRALPDVRDGLKPVQRRILYSMVELNNGPDKPHRKCARIVGDTMGKYHPHGDSSIYGALVNMAQDWSTRYPLVDGHGNFGSVDGDGAAAMRYTEARLSKISMELIADINKDTVDFVPNFDDTEKEPSVLPSRFPNLLVNGTSGIAVGMATNIPPHNLKEVCDAVVKIIDNRIMEDRDTDIEEILPIVKGPDFPTGAEILGKRGIEEAYRTGKGKIKVRAVSEIETLPNGKSEIIITELPYLVNKARLIEKIAELVKDKKVDGITGLSEQSSREGMRVVIEVRKDTNPNVILNQLYKHTQLQDTFGVNMLALKDNVPKVMNLLEMLTYYLAHQEEVVTRRCNFELNKALERAHILQGLLIALDHIDEVISIIRSSENTPQAKERLIEAFALSEAQASAIVEMRLKALTGLERNKLEQEYEELQKQIQHLQAILADRKLLLGVIRTEILEISGKYSDERRTSIGYDDDDISIADMITEETVVIAMTELGYIKRMPIDNFKSQNRGGRGIKGIQMIDDDYIKDFFTTSTHDFIVFITNYGRMYKRKAYEIPEAGRNSRGRALVNLLELQNGEKITAIIPADGEKEDDYLVMATRDGIIKRTPVREFRNLRKTGIIAISLREGDELVNAWYTHGNGDILLISRKGMCIRFNEEDVRPTGRTSIGVIGMNIDEDDEVIEMMPVSEGEYVLLVSERGMGKRTLMSEFHVQIRGGKGVKCYNITGKTGDLISALPVNDEDGIMIINGSGTIIRTRCCEISILGRITSGVKLIRLDNEDKVANVALIRDDDNSDSEEDDNPDGIEEEAEENDNYEESEEE